MLRRAGVIAGGLFAAAAAIGLARAAFTVIRVDGDSMIPSYRSGDAVLIVRRWATRPVCPGDVVVCLLPPGVPGPEGYLVKRVTAVVAGQVTVRGDGPGSYDSRAFGPVAEDRVLGRVLWRLIPRDDPAGRAV
jgi:signal peptidase I